MMSLEISQRLWSRVTAQIRQVTRKLINCGYTAAAAAIIALYWQADARL